MMKRILYTLASVACAAMAFTSCSNDDVMEGNVPEPVMTVTIEAGTPETESETRTELNGTIPMWSVGDKIGVMTQAYDLKTLTSSATVASKTTTFAGTVPMGTTMLYPFYPSVNYGANPSHLLKMEIPELQHPTETSFDGAADMLIGKPISVTDGVDVATLKTQFARVIGVLKVNVKSAEAIIGENLEHLSVAVNKSEVNGLAGRAYLDVQNTKGLTEIYYNPTLTVAAEYVPEMQFALKGTNGAYLCVYPQTLAAGTILTISGTTAGHNFKKEITLKNPIEILPGKLTNLNVTLNAEHIFVRTSGAALPFSDDFSWAAGNESTEISNIKTDSKGNFVYSEKVYHGAGKVKFGSSKKFGVLRTKELDLSKAYTIIVGIELFSNKASSLAIKVDGVDTKKTAVLDKNGTYRFEMPAATGNSTIELTRGTSGDKRFYLNQIDVVEGHGNVELPANINITTTSPVEMGWIGGEGVINYTIDNPKQGTTIVATSNETWVNGFTYAEGTVKFNVDKNTTGALRKATITLTYGDAAPKTVEVKQDLKKAPVVIAADQTIKSDAGTHTFSYQVENPDESTMQAASTDAWISAVNVLAGEVSFTVTANDTGAVRTGKITLTYGAVTKEVKITQEPAGVAAETTVTITAAQISEGGLGTGKVTVEGVTATVGELKFTFKHTSKQDNTTSYFDGNRIRFYGDETLTITSVDGTKVIEHILIHESKGGKVVDIDDPAAQPSLEWTGSKTVLNLKAVKQLRIDDITVTYK